MVRAAINDNLDALPSAIRLFQDMGAPDAWVLGDRAQLQLAQERVTLERRVTERTAELEQVASTLALST